MNAAMINLPSRITAVTVYPDRARIVRTCECTLNSGESLLVIGGLPLGLEDASVQAKGRGLAGAKLQGVTIRRKFMERTSNELIRSLEDALQNIEDRIRMLTDEVTILGLRRDFCISLKDGMVLPDENSRSGPGIDQIKQLYHLYCTELTELTSREQAIFLEQRDLEHSRRKNQEELGRARGLTGPSATEKEACVVITSPSAGALTLDVHYTIRGASWAPLYDVYAQVQDRAIECVYNGMVRQKTGEDWNDVELALSTARPDSQIKMGELGPWWLRVLDERKGPAVRQSTVALDMAYPASMAMAGAPPPPGSAREPRGNLELETSTINSSGFSTLYQLKLPTTIPSDGEVHRTTVSVLSLEGALEHVSTPKLHEAVFLKAKLNNKSGGPILAGPVNLFRDGDFIGNTSLDFVGVDAEIELFLGIDDGIKIERKLLVDKKEVGGVLQRTTRTIRKVQITLENFKPTDESVLVHDQIPVSQSSEVTVSNTQYSLAPKSVNKETGEVIWSVALPKRGKRELTLEFTVEAQDSKVITGL